MGSNKIHSRTILFGYTGALNCRDNPPSGLRNHAVCLSIYFKGPCLEKSLGPWGSSPCFLFLPLPPPPQWACLYYLTLWARCAYIYARARLPLTAMSIYICPQYKQVPTAPSCQAKQDCGVNPYLLSSNKSRPHLSIYITTRKWQEGAVLMCEYREF